MSLRRFRENPGIQHYPKNEAEWKHWINEVAKWIVDSTTTPSTSDVTAAARTSAYAKSVPNGFAWNSDPSTGTFPGGDPTVDIVTTFYDQSDDDVAVRTLRGTLTSAAGTIAVTAVSNSEDTGYSTAYTLVDDGTNSVLAVITLTLPDGSKRQHPVAWNAIDISAAGGTPTTGAGK